MNISVPSGADSLLVRTDYADETAWTELKRRISAENEDGFRARFVVLEERRLAGHGVEKLMDLVRSGSDHTFFFVVDAETMNHDEHPVLVVDMFDEPGRAFRVVPAEMWSVENNLSIANMDFAEFAENVDSDGVFRGFR